MRFVGHVIRASLQPKAGLWGVGLWAAVTCMGCRPAPSVDPDAVQPPMSAQPARSESPRGTSSPQQQTQPHVMNAADPSGQQQWEEQFAQVLAGQSDRILIDAGPVTAEQLAQLPQLAGQLTQLLIDAGGVSDQTLQFIAPVKSLAHLRLRESAISDAGLTALVAAGLPQLRILNIPQAQITAAGIASLGGLPQLVQLRLGGAQIDDVAVAAIAELPKLRSLHLIGPSLTDAALSELAASPVLSTFYLDDCPLSDAAWEQLFAAKPKLHVHVDQFHHDRDPNPH